MRYVMSMVVIAAALSGLAIVGTPHAALAEGYDGNWTVLVITERGTCDRNYSYDVSVSQGKIHYPSYTSVSLYGTVSPQGAVMVSIRHLDDIAQRQRPPYGAHRRRRLAWRWQGAAVVPATGKQTGAEAVKRHSRPASDEPDAVCGT